MAMDPGQQQAMYGKAVRQGPVNFSGQRQKQQQDGDIYGEQGTSQPADFGGGGAVKVQRPMLDGALRGQTRGQVGHVSGYTPPPAPVRPPQQHQMAQVADRKFYRASPPSSAPMKQFAPGAVGPPQTGERSGFTGQRPTGAATMAPQYSGMMGGAQKPRSLAEALGPPQMSAKEDPVGVAPVGLKAQASTEYGGAGQTAGTKSYYDPSLDQVQTATQENNGSTGTAVTATPGVDSNGDPIDTNSNPTDTGGSGGPGAQFSGFANELKRTLDGTSQTAVNERNEAASNYNPAGFSADLGNLSFNKGNGDPMANKFVDVMGEILGGMTGEMNGKDRQSLLDYFGPSAGAYQTMMDESRAMFDPAQRDAWEGHARDNLSATVNADKQANLRAAAASRGRGGYASSNAESSIYGNAAQALSSGERGLAEGRYARDMQAKQAGLAGLGQGASSLQDLLDSGFTSRKELMSLLLTGAEKGSGFLGQLADVLSGKV